MDAKQKFIVWNEKELRECLALREELSKGITKGCRAKWPASTGPVIKYYNKLIDTRIQQCEKWLSKLA